MKTLAVFTGDFPPTNIVGALRPFRLVKHLCKTNWRVLVFTHPPRLNNSLNKELLKEIVGDFEVHFVSPSVPLKIGRSAMSKRVAGVIKDVLKKRVRPDPDIVYLPSYYNKFNKIHSKTPVDILLTTSPAHSIQVAGLLVKKKWNLPWVVDFRDPWDSYPKTGEATPDNPFERFLEKKVVSFSDIVVSTTRTYTGNLKNRYPEIADQKFFTITNSFDRYKTRGNKNKKPDKFVVCYTGIFYPSKDPYGFFRALGKWFCNMTADEKRRYKDRLEIHLLGSGDSYTRRAVREAGVDQNVIFYDRMTHAQAIEKTMQADMALISTGMGEKTRRGWLPSKLFEYLGCRVPILAFIREGEMSEIIRKTNSGHVMTSEDHWKLAGILSRAIDRKFDNGKSQQSDEYTFEGIEQFEEERVVSEYIALLNRIASH